MIQVGKPDELKPKIKKQIVKVFGNLFLEDANFVVLTAFNPSDSDEQKSFIKSFANLASEVFKTEVLKTDVKSFELEDESNNTIDVETDDVEDDDISDDSEDIETDVPNTTTVLLIKVTTK